MKRFGSLAPFLEQGQAERRIGRLVANHDFIKALLRIVRRDHAGQSYPSRKLQPDDLVIATAGAALDASYGELRPLLDPAILAAIVANAAQPTPIATLVTLSPEPSRGWFAVMWLMKYGILARAR